MDEIREIARPIWERRTFSTRLSLRWSTCLLMSPRVLFLSASPHCSPPTSTASMASRKSRAPSSSPSPGPRIPRAPSQHGRGRRHTDEDDNSPPPRKRRPRSRYDGPGYMQPREKHSPNKVDLLLCVFGSMTGHSWRTAPYSFDRRRITDSELWEDLRGLYRDDLQTAWRRILLFKRLKLIAPITVCEYMFHTAEKGRNRCEGVRLC